MTLFLVKSSTIVFVLVSAVASTATEEPSYEMVFEEGLSLLQLKAQAASNPARTTPPCGLALVILLQLQSARCVLTKLRKRNQKVTQLSDVKEL